MTRKDYILIAAAIKGARAQFPKQTLHGSRLVAEYIADALAHDNPRFDRARFLTACGVQS
jgi:hypothetical protein